MKRNIVLIGSMGSGKSHIGRNLAESLGWQFVDTDRMLENRYNMPIAEVYRYLGEKGFRQAERELLRWVSRYHEAVISYGGNFTIDVRTIKWLQRYSYVIVLKATEHRLVSRVRRRIGKRPTMDYTDVAGFVRTMLRTWKPLYKRCDYVLDTTYGDRVDLIGQIQEEIKRQNVIFKKRRKVVRHESH